VRAALDSVSVKGKTLSRRVYLSVAVAGYGWGMQASVRRRDAERSRLAILDAAEGLFAEHGYVGTSMGQIAAVAGLARATPGYLFGSKEALYEAVLLRVHEQRTVALEQACGPLHRWAKEAEGGREGLRDAITAAVGGYTIFLERRPSFGRLIEWESLMGAERLPASLSTSFFDAFRALHRVRRRRGLADFDVKAVVVALVSLCFLPVAHASTFTAAEVDTLEAGFRERYEAQVVDIVLGLLIGAQTTGGD
jgi:AcrR family transcriptional regulator